MQQELKKIFKNPIFILLFIYLALQSATYALDFLNKHFWQIDFTGNTFFVTGTYLFQTILIVGVLLFIKKKQKLTWSDFGFRKTNLLESIGYIVAAYFLYFAISLSVLVTLESIGFSNVPGLIPQESYIEVFGNNTFGIISLFVAALILAPLTEEWLFRGYLLQNLNAKWGSKLSILIVALFFALFHFQIASFFFLFLLGLLINLIYLKADSIWPCIVFHLLNNSFAFLLEILLS